MIYLWMIYLLLQMSVFRTVTGVGVKNALSGVILVKNIRGAYGGISGCDHFS